MKAHELLDSPEKWTQGYFAYDHQGEAVESYDSAAVRWCLVGAIEKCNPELPDFNAVLGRVERKIQELTAEPTICIAMWNDRAGRTYDEVIALLKELDV